MIFKRISNGFSSIKLIDRCLIIFMFILLAQSIYSLFTGETDTQYTSNIDIIIRTTSAAIFGYFLSVNFIRNESEGNDTYQTPSPSPSPNSTVINTIDSETSNTQALPMKNQIGFSVADSTNNTTQTGNITNNIKESKPKSASQTSNQQIIITTMIGMISLLALLYARNFIPLTEASTAGLSHLRDIVSGCVGFLVGCPVGDVKK